MKISQIFGPTIQGEGAAAGRHCLFIRLYGCNLECSWCDTAYTWADTPQKAAKHRDGIQYKRYDPELGLKEMSVDDVLAQLDKLWAWRERPTTIIVSGGEPLMQQEALVRLGKILRSSCCEMHIETAGTIAPTYELVMNCNQFNVSPKLANSHNRLEMRYKPPVLRVLNGSRKAWFKFVVTHNTADADFEEIDQIVKECEIPPRKVQVMPEGNGPLANIATSRLIIDRALERGYGLSFRSHVMLWPHDNSK